MSDDASPVIVGVMHGDPRAWVPLEDHERLRRETVLLTSCMKAIAVSMNAHADGKLSIKDCFDKVAAEMNLLADRYEAENLSVTTETRPAPL